MQRLRRAGAHVAVQEPLARVVSHHVSRPHTPRQQAQPAEHTLHLGMHHVSSIVRDTRR